MEWIWRTRTFIIQQMKLETPSLSSFGNIRWNRRRAEEGRGREGGVVKLHYMHFYFNPFTTIHLYAVKIFGCYNYIHKNICVDDGWNRELINACWVGAVSPRQLSKTWDYIGWPLRIFCNNYKMVLFHICHHKKIIFSVNHTFLLLFDTNLVTTNS